MISDIVLLKELSEAVKKNVQAYISCVAGAVTKEEYIELIKEAGFQDVKIIEETSFPIDFITDDPTVEALMKDLNVSFESAEEFASSIASIKVYGIKPR